MSRTGKSISFSEVVLRPSPVAWLRNVGLNVSATVLVVLGVVMLTMFVTNGFLGTLIVGGLLAGLILVVMLPRFAVVRIELDSDRLRYRGLIRRVSFARGDVGHVSVWDRSMRGVVSCVVEIYGRSPNGYGWGRRLLKLDGYIWSRTSITMLADFLGREWIVSEVGRYYNWE